MTESLTINKAIFAQLNSCKGIGEVKVNAILRAREEKDTLTEDNRYELQIYLVLFDHLF